ncbi:Two-component system sensor histidine kinase/response regulator hybrid [hydrothermal vent metagenome]|uniref:Two-component system sensor histidine kinase/response regulator hybrid n=1 Tax=hydrothermal vent metagenome TaxID=652676 RepID=A0A3B0XYF5_9ZZZZ
MNKHSSLDTSGSSREISARLASRFGPSLDEMSENQNFETAEVVRHIAAGVSAKTGKDFFRSLVIHLAKIFNADYAFVGKLNEQKSLHINTLAVCAHDKIVDNIEYSLKDTPCANVIGNQTCAHPDSVQQLYPRDQLLIDMGIEGYIGTPLFDSQGKSLGLLVVLHSTAILKIAQVSELLEIFAARTSAELERLRAEDELKQYRDQLEALVEERTKELYDIQKKLLRKERLATLGQLTATVSHELRNPLGSIRNSLAVIQRIADKNNPMMNNALQISERGILRCDNIISELLDFSRIKELNLTVQDVDVWLGEVANDYDFPHGITVTLNLNSQLKFAFDQERLLRAMINILNNACESLLSEQTQTHEPKSLCVTISTLLIDNLLEIKITDNGPGMSNKLQENIYEPLFSTKTFGVGLGLPVVKQIVTQHGGNVMIQSKEKKGAQVSFMLPIKKTELCE